MFTWILLGAIVIQFALLVVLYRLAQRRGGRIEMLLFDLEEAEQIHDELVSKLNESRRENNNTTAMLEMVLETDLSLYPSIKHREQAKRSAKEYA